MSAATAVLIPCFNEEPTIQKVIRDFQEALPDAVIYVYDNNSTDQTKELAEQMNVCVRHAELQGKGNVVRKMFNEIDAACYIMVDGDDTYPADDAEMMQQLVLTHNVDMVIGDRLSSTYFYENNRPFHNFGNRLVRGLTNTLFHGHVQDIMTGYRAFSRKYVAEFHPVSKGFEIETEMTIFALQHHMKIWEVPILYRDRPEGSFSKLNTFSDGMKVLRTIFKMAVRKE